MVASWVEKLRKEGAEEEQRLRVAERDQHALQEEAAARRLGWRRAVLTAPGRAEHLPAQPDQISRAG